MLKIALINLLIWFIIPFVIFILVGETFLWFAIIGAFVVLFVDYIAIKKYRYLPIALLGLILAVLMHIYVI